MSKFFSKLVSENLFEDWAQTLDWLFDDLKFSKTRNWNKGYVCKLTNNIKKLEYLSDNNRVRYGKIKNTDFPNQVKNSRQKHTPYIFMKESEGFTKDLIRHIRNGIAHGQTKIFKVSDDLYIEIKDFSDKSMSLEKQNAYIFIPIKYIVEIYKKYTNINSSIMNTKPKDRKATKKSKKGV